MKNRYNTLISLCMGAVVMSSLNGCMDDFLNVPPVTDISPDTYLVDESHLAAYTIKRYSYAYGEKEPKYGFVADGCDIYFADWGTDNQSKRNYNNRWIPGQWKVGQNGGSWSFAAIYPLNYFLSTVVPRYEAGTITGNVDNIKHYIGEGYFLRAYEYFNYLKNIGDFPIIKEVLPDSRVVLIEASKRSPRTEVARFILEDLDKAIALMKNNPDGGRNRLTQDAAYLLKSRVALFEGTWLKHHKGTALVPQGAGWPGAGKEYSKYYQFQSGSIDNEITFFLGEAMSAAKVVVDRHANLTANSKVIKQTVSDASNPYVEMFNSVDLSKVDEVLFWRKFSNSLTIRHTYNGAVYAGGSNGYTRQFVDNFLMQNGLPVYASGSGYKGDDLITDVKVDRDWRLRLFMKAPGENKAFLNIGTPEIEPLPRIYTASTDEGNNSGTGYDIKKGLSYDKAMSSGYGMDITGLPIFRAAEAYLNYVEACYEKNGIIDADADKYWKAIRARAGINTDYLVTIVATDMNKEAKNDWGAYSAGKLIDATLYNIRRERRCEFIAEGMRYDDLRRWRALDQVKDFQIEGIKLWGPMKDLENPTVPAIPGKSDYKDYFSYGSDDETKNNVSSPELSQYFRVHQVNINKGNLAYDGYNWCEAHYLEPIAVAHFLDTAEDSKSVATSPIYQNPGWPIEAGAAPNEYK